MMRLVLKTDRALRILAAAATLILSSIASQSVLAQSAAESGLGGPTLQKILTSGRIYPAHREMAVPFSYVGSDKWDYQVEGYSWEICGRIISALSERAGKKIEVVPVPVTANTRFLMVKTKMADMECGASTNNVARQKLVSFSTTIYVAEVKVLVRTSAAISRISDLGGKRVVTVAGTTADRLIKGAALINQIAPEYTVVETHADAMRMMEEGQADAYVGDDAIVAATRARSKTPDAFAFLDEALSAEPYGLVLPKDDAQFKKFVDEVIVSLITSGEMEKIYNRWFMSPIPPNGINLAMPMSARVKAAFASPNDRPVN